ncbi:MAG: hypothetical protein EP329_20055 [Deltaproteobacteria bacterium]|nr:MAG: hypothetical protein EP329_20055 [Deltaproteobacteria bacterium]
MTCSDPRVHRLEPAHTDFVMAHLERLIDDAPRCPMCRRAHWQVNDRVDVYQEDPEDDVQASVALRCVECGYVALFDALILRLIHEDGDLATPEELEAIIHALDEAAGPDLPPPPVPPRELWWRWVVIRDLDQHMPSLVSELGGGDVGIGFLYLDRDAGANVFLDAVALATPEGLVVTGRPPAGQVTLLRPGSIPWDAIGPLSGGVRAVPDWIERYQRPELDDLRAQVELDWHRAEGYPDDLRVVLIPPAIEVAPPEAVWVRVTGESADGAPVGVLLNQPGPQHGVRVGETVTCVFDPTSPHHLYAYSPGTGGE